MNNPYDDIEKLRQILEEDGPEAAIAAVNADNVRRLNMPDWYRKDDSFYELSGSGNDFTYSALLVLVTAGTAALQGRPIPKVVQLYYEAARLHREGAPLAEVGAVMDEANEFFMKSSHNDATHVLAGRRNISNLYVIRWLVEMLRTGETMIDGIFGDENSPATSQSGE